MQGFFLQIDIAKIVTHKTHQPNSIFDFLQANGPTRQRNAEIDLLVEKAETATASDHNSAVVERIVRLGKAAIGATRS